MPSATLSEHPKSAEQPAGVAFTFSSVVSAPTEVISPKFAAVVRLPCNFVRLSNSASKGSTVRTMTALPDSAFDSDHFRTVMGHFPTGVTVVTGLDLAGTPHGFTIGSFTSVSLDPAMVGFLPQIGSATWDAIATSQSFCVNVLSNQQSDLCWKFAKSSSDDTRFNDVAWHAAPSGSPILDRAVAWVDCSVKNVFNMGDHHFVLGMVGALDADADHDGRPPKPLLFYKGTLGGFDDAEG